ncbi:MAG: MATE family efflux transporter [Anaerolineae bacterium]|nr:MATE family efflux transporter [Anaerolineae bacterium]
MLTFFVTDKEFLVRMVRLAGPIILQQLVMVLLGLIDMLMIGQLGDVAVAGVGLANQVFFLLFLLLFGISSGAAIFTAQYWGRRDVRRIRSVLGLGLLLSLTGGLAFTLVGLLLPTQVLGIYSTDPAVIATGEGYLRLVALGFIATAITYSYGGVLRSIEQVKLPMVISLLAVGVNTILNYGLIFGHFGLPALGVDGAAIATTGARWLECSLLLLAIYHRRLPLAARLSELFHWTAISLPQYFKTSLPVVLTEILWSLGVTTYHVVYARIGTEAIAAVNIALSIDRVMFVIFIGMAHAAAIMIGNQIGAGGRDRAMVYARRFLVLGPLVAVAVGALLMLIANPILGLYQVSDLTRGYAYRILVVIALLLAVRVSNMLLLIGVLRSGGDTRFGFFIDAGAIWVVGVPLAMMGAFVWHWPVYAVYLLVMAEEVVKLSLGLWRVFSQRWIHQLAVPA